jgi:aspartyl/asparaginyl beta-hydroxylase (cupin superfamily)
VNLTGNDFAVKVILVDIGTNVTFYLRDAYCEKEVPPENNYWHAGKKRILTVTVIHCFNCFQTQILLNRMVAYHLA